MTWLFLRFYIGVLTVLFIAWYIYGWVFDQRTAADLARVISEAHGGGARLVAEELSAAGRESRGDVLTALQKQFDYGVDVWPITALPSSLQKKLAATGHVAYFEPEGERGTVVTALAGGKEIVRLGPFPQSDLRHIEKSVGGWMRLAAHKLNQVSPEQQDATLTDIQKRFQIPLALQTLDSLPEWPKVRFTRGDDIVFYRIEEMDSWFSATPLADEKTAIRFGPFPNFQQSERPAATTTLGLVLLPAAFAIALLLRPVARQLRRIENAAEAIAGGDLSARVDERKVASAQHLAQTFNNMASRTETLVRTQRELLQAVSHELRTPLSRMRFAIDLIGAAKSDQERQKRLESLDASTEELDELVGELLSYVRMETSGPQLKPERVDVKDAVEHLIPKYAGLHPNVEFSIHEQMDESDVFADRAGFQRAMGNLLSNAGRFAKNRVSVAASTSNGTTTIDVDDDGHGIPIADRERVLEPFVRLENSANESGRGVGLGLALVRRIVIRNGGTIEIKSSPAGGCRMRTTWPSNLSANEVQPEA